MSRHDCKRLLIDTKSKFRNHSPEPIHTIWRDSYYPAKVITPLLIGGNYEAGKAFRTYLAKSGFPIMGIAKRATIFQVPSVIT